MLAALEGAWRARRRAPAGAVAVRLDGLVLVAVAVTAAGGLGLLVGGARPRELLHFVYAGVALAALPISISISASWEPRRRGITTLVGALVALAAILRLFATG